MVDALFVGRQLSGLHIGKLNDQVEGALPPQ